MLEPPPAPQKERSVRKRRSLGFAREEMVLAGVTEEDRQYLEACLALGIDPKTGEKTSGAVASSKNGKANRKANGKSGHDSSASGARAQANAEALNWRMTDAQRKEKQRREALIAQIENHAHLAEVYEGQAEYHREQYEKKLGTL